METRDPAALHPANTFVWHGGRMHLLTRRLLSKVIGVIDSDSAAAAAHAMANQAASVGVRLGAIEAQAAGAAGPLYAAHLEHPPAGIRTP